MYNIHMSWVIWITGLPGSGKSTIASRLKELIPSAVILSMDEARKIITPQPCYSEKERDYVYRSIVFTAMILNSLGQDVIIDATAHRRRWRALAREVLKNFFEIYVKCPLRKCMERERGRTSTHGAPPEIYEKAAKGHPVPGMSVPYEEPHRPDIVIDSERETPDEATQRIIRMLDESERRVRE